MRIPFTGDLTGTSLCVRTTGAEHTDRQIYHFMADATCRCEFSLPDGKRSRSKFRYRHEGGIFTLIFLHNGSEREYGLTLEEDGVVRLHDRNGVNWCMVRLTEPMPYSWGFVDDGGVLRKSGEAG